MKMKLTLDGIKDKKSWEAAGVVLPSYDIEKVKEDCERDHYLSAKEAMEYGLIDKVIERSSK